LSERNEWCVQPVFLLFAADSLCRRQTTEFPGKSDAQSARKQRNFARGRASEQPSVGQDAPVRWPPWVDG